MSLVLRYASAFALCNIAKMDVVLFSVDMETL